MSGYTNHMEHDEVYYRGVLAYERTPMQWVDDPTGALDWSGRVKRIRVPSGPEETITDIIGPYASLSPIKGYVTRHRSSHKNLRVVRFEKVTGWEEVEE